MLPGVLVGAAIPNQFEATKPGKPDSAIVGTSGNIEIRSGVATANAVSLPPLRLVPTAANPIGKT